MDSVYSEIVVESMLAASLATTRLFVDFGSEGLLLCVGFLISLAIPMEKCQRGCTLLIWCYQEMLFDPSQVVHSTMVLVLC